MVFRHNEVTTLTGIEAIFEILSKNGCDAVKKMFERIVNTPAIFIKKQNIGIKLIGTQSMKI